MSYRKVTMAHCDIQDCDAEMLVPNWDGWFTFESDIRKILRKAGWSVTDRYGHRCPSHVPRVCRRA